jgi:hypothetical protein
MECNKCGKYPIKKGIIVTNATPHWALHNWTFCDCPEGIRLKKEDDLSKLLEDKLHPDENTSQFIITGLSDGTGILKRPSARAIIVDTI